MGILLLTFFCNELQTSVLHKLLDELRYNRERRQLEMEWYQLAILVDKLAMIVYIIYPFAAVSVLEATGTI